MKLALSTLLMSITMAGFGAEPENTYHLRTASIDLDHDGINETYTEILKDGDNIIVSNMLLADRREICFWFDQQRSLILVDTNQDGRIDEFVFSNDNVPEKILIRNSEDRLEPIDPQALLEIHTLDGILIRDQYAHTKMSMITGNYHLQTATGMVRVAESENVSMDTLEELVGKRVQIRAVFRKGGKWDGLGQGPAQIPGSDYVYPDFYSILEIKELK